MALDIVYGYQGKEHVKASQLARLLSGTFGGGRYVLDTQDGLKATMQTANKVRIGTGDLVMDGRYITNEAYQELTVESGQSGYNRNDIVGVQYTRASGSDADHSIETTTLKVLKGAQTTGSASDPSYTAGDIAAGDASAFMPLWRLPITGLNVGTPVKLFETRASCSEVNERFGKYKVLATCNSFMNESDNFKLSEKVSEQPHGIVLCWSFYNGGSVDYSWSYFFVPKEHVSRHSGWGLSNSALFSDYNMVKYVYVGDDFVKGSATNVKNEQMNGLFVHNNKYVLRRVLGV